MEPIINDNLLSFWERVWKGLLQPLFLALFSYILPMGATLIIIILVGFLSTIIGYKSSKIHNGEHFNAKKFNRFFNELLAITGAIAAIGLIGGFWGVPRDTMELIGKIVGVIAVFSYVKTLIKNARRFYPHSTFFRFIEYFLDFEIVNFFRNPIIERFRKQECKLEKGKICDDCGKCIIDEYQHNEQRNEKANEEK